MPKTGPDGAVPQAKPMEITRSPDPLRPYVAVAIRGGHDSTSYMLIDTRTQAARTIPGNLRGYEPQLPALGASPP